MVATKKKKAPAKKKTSYVRCSVPKCRKKAIEGSKCTSHAEAAFPIDRVVRVTELEAARFAALDAEIRNSIQGTKILELEIEAADGNLRTVALRHKADQNKRNADKAAIEAAVQIKRAEYTDFVTALGEKYDLDPQQMTVDPDTRLLRDLRERP